MVAKTSYGVPGGQAPLAGQVLTAKAATVDYSLLGGGLIGSGGGGSGSLLSINLGDLLGGGGSGGGSGGGLIDLGIGLGGSGLFIDLTLLGGLLGGGGNDIGVDLDLDGVVDGEVSVLSDGSLLQGDLDLLGGLASDGIAGVDLDLDGVVDLMLNLGDGDADGPQAGFVNVDLDLDGVLDGVVGVGGDGTLIEADLDLLGGLADDGLLGIDLNLDGVVDVVVDVGGEGPGGEDPGGEDPGGEDPGGEDPGGEDPGGEDPGGEDPGGEDPGGEDPGGEDPGGEDPGGEDPGGEDPGGEDPGGELGFDLFRAYQEITRVAPTSPEAPQQEVNLLAALSQSVDNGSITLEQAIWRVVEFANDTTSVATTTYQFFTGRIPREAGLDYLVNVSDTVNPTDLNDPYYAQFNLENRYINFASNLGRPGGEGQAFFQAEYGALTFEQAVVKAYDEIFGFEYAQENGYDTTASINDILGRKAYFYQVAEERIGGNIETAAKAGLIGYLLGEAVKAEFGVYGEGNAKFLFDLADGDAAFLSDMTVAYGPATVAMLGQSETSPGMYDTVVA